MAKGVLWPAWRWILVAVVFVAVFVFLILAHAGESLTSAAVVELSKDLITAGGLLLAFTGIIFTGMLAEIRFRTERATQAGKPELTEKLEQSSSVLRKSAFASFVLFSSALGVAIGNLAAALGAPSNTFSMNTVFIVPSFLAFGGIAFLVIALGLLAAQ